MSCTNKSRGKGLIVATTLFVALLGARAIALSEPPKIEPTSSQPSHYEFTKENISIPQGQVKIAGYLAKPKSDAPVPGLILIHEWYGLNDWVKQQADRFAEKGYVALAVDLYRGEVAKDGEHAHELMRGLPDERALGDIKAAFAELAMRKEVRGEKIGIIGWCMGGGFALKMAIEEPKVDACVICYGRPVTDVKQLTQIKCSILGIWGETDRGIDVEPFKKALKEAKVDATHHVFPGAGHAFLNQNNQRGYNKEQAEKAWKTIDDFLAKSLKRQPVGKQVEQKSP